MTTPVTRGQIATALGAVYVVWGSTYLAIRIGVESLPPLLMAGVRFVVAGGLMYAWARWPRPGRGERRAAKPSRVYWKSAAIVGGFLLVLGNGGVCMAERTVPSGLTALLIATTPLWMALLDWLWHGAARPSGRMVAGLALGFIGAGLLVAPGKLAGGERVEPVGAAILMLATMSWAVGSLWSRRVELPASPVLATAMEMLAGGLILLAVSGATGEWGRLRPGAVSGRSLWALGYLIVFGSMIGFSAYVWLLRVTTTAVASTYAYANPLIAVVLGAVVAGEAISMRILLAGAAIIVAVVLIISEPVKREVSEPV